MDLTFLLNKLESAPAGFGFSDVTEWLKDVVHLSTLESIEDLFFEKLTKKQWLALLILIKQRYIKEGPAYNLFDDHLEQYIQLHGLEDFYETLFLYGDKSKNLDFSFFKKQLTKLSINACSNLTTITFSVNHKLEALNLSHLVHLVNLTGIERLKNLRFLAINKCPLITDFSFIKQVKHLIWLDLSYNPQMEDINFLLPSQKVVILQLLDNNLLDNPKNIRKLTQLKYLRFLIVSGQQNKISLLREKLPHCVINGISALG